MTTKRRVPAHILYKLKDVRATAMMETASFGFPNDCVKATGHFEANFEGHPDEYIKEKTRLWRESWIKGPLDDIIAWAEGRSNG